METYRADSDDVSVRWSNHLDLIEDGASAVNSFVVRPTIPWNMFVALDNTTLTYQFLRVSTSHFVGEEVSWIPLARLPVKPG